MNPGNNEMLFAPVADPSVLADDDVCVVSRQGLQEQPPSPVRLPCGHAFHISCIRPWTMAPPHSYSACRRVHKIRTFEEFNQDIRKAFWSISVLGIEDPR